MSLANHLAPYLLSDDLGPDDLSDVDLTTPAFLALFPDGTVPIRHVPYTYLYEGDPLAHLELILAVSAASEPYDVDRLSELRSDLVAWETDGGDDAIAAYHDNARDRRALIAEMMGAGLTLRQIARYVGWSDLDLVRAACHERALDPEPYLLADEAITEGAWSVRALARTHGIDRHAVDRLVQMRQGQCWSPATST